MASLFGAINLETPPYELIKKFDKFEIRKYEKMDLVYISDPEENSGFRQLAKYIGVMGKAENDTHKKIPMSAPVFSGPLGPIASDSAMSFYIPSQYEPLPKPLNPLVETAKTEPLYVAVYTFSGGYDMNNVAPKVKELEAELTAHSIQKSSDHFVLARYNPPWTLWFLRTNEIWQPVQAELFE